MAYKLEKLTDKQVELMEKVKSEWLGRLFVDRKPCDRRRAMELIQWLYSLAKLEKPLVIFVNSPAGAQIAANILNGAQVGNQVWDQVRAQVGNQVGDQVGAQVGNQVWDQVRAQVRAQVGDQRLEYYSFSGYGNIWDFGWLSFYDFFDRLNLDLIKNDNFHRFKELMQTGVYDMIQLDKYCIVCELPKVLLRDDRNRLHSEEEAAISWEDGYKQHYLNGIYLPEELWKKITKKRLSFKACMAIENMEQRMVALKYLDPEKLLRQAKAKSIDHAKGYELFQVSSIFPSTQYFLKYTCPSTGRIYVSGIDPEVGRKKSAIEALKWKFYLEDEKREELFDKEA